MVPFEMVYYRPDTIEEALELYQQLRRKKKNPAFYGGGTEILTRTRVQDADFDAVIDLKRIPECTVQSEDQGQMQFGSALKLTDLSDKNLWPLLAKTADRVADHTARGQITMGGNFFSVLPYRESILPFLLADSAEGTVATPSGLKTKKFSELFDQNMKVNPGEFLVSVSIDGREARGMAHRSRKMTRLDWIDYPLVTIALTAKPDGQFRAAFSGWTSYPFVSTRVNKILSDRRRTPEERAQDAVQHMPMRAVTDIHGSQEYREFVTGYTLASMLEELEEEIS